MPASPPIEAWILAGELDGQPGRLDPLARVAGMPLLLRHACEIKAAGIERATLIWLGGADDAPDLDALASDPRLGAMPLFLEHAIPAEPGGDVVVIRADRVFHRSLPRLVAEADPSAPVRTIAGDDYDSVFALRRERAHALAEAAAEPGGIDALVESWRGSDEVVEVRPPYLGFSVAAPDRAALRRAERLLVRSLKKKADGYAARILNRRISLPISRLLARTSVHPNHATVACFLLALAGGIIVAQGGYANGVVGVLLFELASICDGIDGELARLKCQFSRLGQWMDTVTDDISNLFLATGTAISLSAAGAEWAYPVLIAGAIAFAITQSAQYYLIAVVYDSGDLAAIPWAFQSTEFLESRPTGLIPRLRAAIPKLLKRDLTITLFLALAIAGFLEGILLLFAGGAIVFFFSFWLQFARWRAGRA